MLFGTSGIRGPAETFFTNQVSFNLGRTFAKFLQNKGWNGSVAVGSDPRDSSPRIKKAVISGLSKEGFETLDEGITPIPSMNYILIADNSISGSIMVSGSHIKADLNGLKFFANKEEISKEDEAEITSIYQALQGEALENLQNGKTATLKEDRAKDLYIERLSSLGMKYPGWKAVVDPGNGAQTRVMPGVLTNLGAETIKLNADLGKPFLARDTEVESDFSQLQRKVLEEKADFGVGYDSDGDRAVFVDEKGRFIPGDYTGALVAKDSNSQTIVTPINSSQVIEKLGKNVIRTKVGSPYVVAAIKDSGSSFGYEANGGGIWADMLSRDGGRMTIEVLNILAKRSTKLSELIGELPKFYIKRDKVEYKPELKNEIIIAAKRKFVGVKTEELDGLKIWINENSWILFRSSANAPEFRVFAESNDEATSEKLLSDGLRLVKKTIANYV